MTQPKKRKLELVAAISTIKKWFVFLGDETMELDTENILKELLDCGQKWSIQFTEKHLGKLYKTANHIMGMMKKPLLQS